MYFVAQVDDLLVGSLQPCSNYNTAVEFALRVVGRNGEEITDEIREAIKMDGYYLPVDGKWSVCILVPERNVFTET